MPNKKVKTLTVDGVTYDIKDDNAVHKSGDERISGYKTIEMALRFDSAYTGGRGFLYQQQAGQLVLGLYNDDESAWSQNYMQFTPNAQTRINSTTNVQLSGSTPATTNIHPVASSNDTSIATTKWVNDKLGSDLFGALYPVGSIYIGTQSTCPLATLISGSTWERVEAGRALWTGNGNNGNSKIAAGLPNITGSINLAGGVYIDGATGSFVGVGTTGGISNYVTSVAKPDDFKIDASKSSSIYGNSTTVQPPAYVVNVWRRTK